MIAIGLWFALAAIAEERVGEALVFTAIVEAVGEAGEVAEKIKKFFRDNTLDEEAIQKELGDVIFYWYALHGALGLDPQETIDKNVEKLSSRKERGTLRGNGDNR